MLDLLRTRRRPTDSGRFQDLSTEPAFVELFIHEAAPAAVKPARVPVHAQSLKLLVVREMFDIYLQPSPKLLQRHRVQITRLEEELWRRLTQELVADL